MTKDDKITSLQKSVQTLTFLVIVLILAVGFLFVRELNAKTGPANIAGAEITQAPTEPFPLVESYPKLKKDDHVKGNRKSKYLLIEYSDYECPFCKTFHETVMAFMNNHKDLAFVYRHFPLSQIHQQALDEAIASECAAKLGGNDAFWQFTDKIFETTTSNDGLDLSLLPQFASEVGVNVDEFNACYTNKETQNLVDADYNDGAKFGVSGTPGSFLINTQSGKAVNLPGALPLAQMEEAFQKIQ